LKPSIDEIIGGYLLKWDDIGLEARTSRLNVHSDGHISGLLQMTHNNGTGLIRLLPNTQFNFSSEVTRNRTAKQLENKFPALSFQWLEIFDGLGEFIQERALSGTPSVEIETEGVAEPPSLLIEPIIYEGHQNIIFGDKGSNKSTLAYALGLILSTPEFANPLELIVESEPMRVMVLDWETDQRTFEWYIKRLNRGLGYPPAKIYYRRCRLPLVQDIELIATDVSSKNINLLIIDSLGAAAGGESGELKGSQAALQFNSALRYLPGITTLIIGQTAKGQDSNKTIFGSTYFTYYARNIFELTPAIENEGSSLKLGLFHRECNFNQKHKPIGIGVKFSPDAIELERINVDMDDFLGKMKDTYNILQVLKSGAKDVNQIAKATGIKMPSLRVTLSRLKKQGKVINLATGMWGLPSDFNP